MALFALLLVVILIFMGAYTVVYFVVHITRGRRSKLNDLTTDQQSTHTLLVELDSLMARNLISEEEYEAKRKQIMEDFISRTTTSPYD
jgi:hypothetical protein